jgi:hypothetical protein
MLILMINQTSNIPNRCAKKKRRKTTAFPPHLGATQFYVKFIKKFNIEFQPVEIA